MTATYKNRNFFYVTRDAMNGIRLMLSSRSVRLEVFLILVAFLVFGLYPSPYFFALFTLSFLLLAIESINLGIANLPDNVAIEHGPGIKSAKDLGAAAILLISALIVLIIGFSLTSILGIAHTPDELLSKVKMRLLTRAHEYLPFVGMTFLSLILLQNKKWISAKAAFLVGVLWLTFHRSILDLIQKLGVDSFNESKNFDWNEAVFWASTLNNEIVPAFNAMSFLFYTTIAVISFFTLSVFLLKFQVTRKNYSILKFSTAILIGGTGLYLALASPISLFLSNSESYLVTRSNFTAVPIPQIQHKPEPLTVLMYIGESTSTMNMGIYGYPRNTTPHLDKISQKDPNLIVFNNVFSTHVHTSPSLLEALSFGSHIEENGLPINRRKRLPLIDVLNEGGIKTKLYSNQGSTGTWNQVSSIIFGNAVRHFSTESRLFRNQDHILAKPWDDEYFDEKITKEATLSSAEKSLIVFHSYAGHGEYLNNIPESFRQKIDRQIDAHNPESIMGMKAGLLADIDNYDSAIRYIDFSVSQAIKFIKGQNKPLIFLYFSDHGDAVYTGRGHDSARFSHEMARVPLILYFNEAAKNSHPDLFEKYKSSSLEGKISTLAQLPSTVLDLLGVKILANNSPILETPTIGQSATHPPIIVREIADNITYVNLNKETHSVSSIIGKKLVDKSDDATKIFVTAANNPSKNTHVCYHRSNTAGKALRASLTADCIEIDILAKDDGRFAVYHPPAIDSGFALNDVLKIIKKRPRHLWLDSKNLQSEKACFRLLDALGTIDAVTTSLLIEFPNNSHRHKNELLSCAAEMKKKGYATSYYVRTSDAMECSLALAKEGDFSNEKSCAALHTDLKLAVASDLFTDLSFDYSGVKAMETIDTAKSFKWNTWNVTPDLFDHIQPERFRMVILNNQDPNNL